MRWVLDPPLRELWAAPFVVETDNPEVAVDRVRIGRRAGDDGEPVGEHQWLPLEGRLAGFVSVGEPVLDDALATDPRRTVRIGVVLGVLGEEPRDVVGEVRV